MILAISMLAKIYFNHFINYFYHEKPAIHHTQKTTGPPNDVFACFAGMYLHVRKTG
jgi:hypothetical protein